MKIAYCSDLHLDFSFPEKEQMLVPADMLVLAGDTIEAKWFDFATNPNSGKHGQAQDLVYFLETLANHYPQVVMLMGNHEHYFGNIEQTQELIHDSLRILGLDNHISLKERDTFLVGDKVFYAATGWTDMGCPSDHWFINHGMNDFRLIRKAGYSKFRAADAALIHAKVLADIKACQPDVILLHHAPSYQSIHQQFAGDTLNAAYASKAMENLLLGLDKQPELVIHGHTHNPVDYLLGDKIRVVSNPKGYDSSNAFKVKVVEV